MTDLQKLFRPDEATCEWLAAAEEYRRAYNEMRQYIGADNDGTIRVSVNGEVMIYEDPDKHEALMLAKLDGKIAPMPATPVPSAKPVYLPSPPPAQMPVVVVNRYEPAWYEFGHWSGGIAFLLLAVAMVIVPLMAQ